MRDFFVILDILLVDLFDELMVAYLRVARYRPHALTALVHQVVHRQHVRMCNPQPFFAIVSVLRIAVPN